MGLFVVLVSALGLFIVINSVDTVFLRMLWLLFVVGLIVTYTYS